MRKLFSAICVAIIALTSLSSCNKNIEGDFTFNTSILSNLTSESEDRFNEIVALIQQQEFFTKPTTVHGTFSDASTKIANEFIDNVMKIDGDAIQAKLVKDEYIEIVLSVTGTGEVIAYVGWTAEPEKTGEEE